MTLAFTSVDQVLDALAGLDGVRGDDVVPALPHLLQTADRLAAGHPDDPELVAAGLVHDLASGLDPAVADHARAGAALIEPLLGRRVAHLVAGHAEAKRYLVTTEPGYGQALSENSTFTLVGQGGPMAATELEAFEADPDSIALVALRRADDAAKVPDAPTTAVSDWRDLLEQVAIGRRPTG